MRDRLKRAVFTACLGMLSLLIADSACAASLGKIEVASHIGEPFYAEVPLTLDSDELISQVFVQIADKGDYRIFEVYRDPVLSAIRADLVSDKRGARVQLSSRTTISTPYFNLVLKIRTGRVSYFRKYPVFLDAGKAMQAAASKKPQPTVTAVSGSANDAATTPVTNTSGQVVAPVKAPVAAAQDDNWARTGKYGPIVRGDSLSTIASRLRVDHRYSLNQTMVALFDKNRDSFDKQNMNLLKAGSVLKVPSAAEVEVHSKQEALQIMRQHQQAWKKLTEQPHYAAVAEAQRTRYSPRVSVGKQADVEAVHAPATTTQTQTTVAESKSAAAPAEPTVSAISPSGEGQATAPAEQAAQSAANNAVLAETNKLLASMQQKNEQLQEQLGQNSQTMKALQDKIDTLAIESSKARIDKLEILIARLQDQQEKERRQQTSVGQVAATADWIVWLLTALVLVLIAVVVILLRREPAHPGASVNLDIEQPVTAPDAAPVKVAPVEPAEAAVPSASDAPAETIESEVSEIEEGAVDRDHHQEADNLVDALSDTATAELEPFDSTAAALDPEIDYVSEADVYIRYGMYEEALQQLEMALRLQPDNVQAHIKKAEILLNKSDAKGFDETIAVATMALAPTDLARFRASVTELGGDVDEKAPLLADEEPVIGEAVGSGDTLQIDEEDLDELNFKLTDFDNEKKGEEAPQPEEQKDQATGELDWLFDDAFDNEEASADTNHEDTSADHAATVDQVGDQEAGATQELDNLLQEFSEERSVEATDKLDSASQPETAATQADSMQQTGEVASTDADMGATMRLDQLFGEFYGDDDEEPINFESHDAEAAKPAEKSPVVADSEADVADSSNDDASATTRLDQLLGEFDNDDDFINFDDAGELGKSVFDVPAKERSLSGSATDIDHGATQELDSLLGAFADNDDESSQASDELDASFFESGEADRQDDEMDAFDVDHGATQELDVLLGAFADDDASFNMDESTDSQGIDSIDKARREDDDNTSDEGATQVLGHLLDEFTKPDKDENKS
ncbi:FimV/HubP family polar landmark protein [Mariprofundus ferrooxydans]|uniref:FimV/HubP family polar landmark protein n=1 Tax=Mariprofundus ferrooxydans TaxID=314344 RepID=UPI00035F5CF1|nr:FimV/HubP family polar landmark protein [Mariprofundus ferrooxydans]